MKTKVFEYHNNENEIIKGIVTNPDSDILGGVLCIHGFERCSSTEKKFKVIADDLVKNNISTLRLDFDGCGLSDGDFGSININKRSNDLINIIDIYINEVIKSGKITIISHSLGGFILANIIDKVKDSINKVVLIAPALNQRDLLRYWFVGSKIKKIDPSCKINWDNHKQYLDEEEFLKNCKIEIKETKSNYIGPEYFLYVKDIDLSNSFDYIEDLKVLHIHGNKDNIVPIGSINTKFENSIIVENGDHDMEKPNQLGQRKDKVIDFIVK